MKMSAISLNCFKIEAMKGFYALLGAEFNKYQITIGSEGYRADMNGVEVNLLPVSEKVFGSLMNDQQRLVIPAYQITLAVPAVKTAFDQIRQQFPTAILSDIISSSEGTFVLLEDPQGNKVQLVQER
jgi:predicted enzyme related to lactoylglutathione lyase